MFLQKGKILRFNSIIGFLTLMGNVAIPYTGLPSADYLRCPKGMVVSDVQETKERFFGWDNTDTIKLSPPCKWSRDERAQKCGSLLIRGSTDVNFRQNAVRYSSGVKVLSKEGNWIKFRHVRGGDGKVCPDGNLTQYVGGCEEGGQNKRKNLKKIDFFESDNFDTNAPAGKWFSYHQGNRTYYHENFIYRTLSNSEIGKTLMEFVKHRHTNKCSLVSSRRESPSRGGIRG